MELCMICCLALLMINAFYSGKTRADNVTYDGRSLIINGEHRLLFSGSIHYPRSTPEMWPSLIAKAKEGGLDVIQTYVFWNLHEPQQGQYDFNGRKDLVRFIKEVQAQDLYVCLRIGPFIESEWNYGGLPFWLHDIPGIIYRSDNELFKFHMKDFTSKIVNMMKAEKLYATQGGPIILSQIENEYNIVEAAFHESGTSYVRWAAEMAVGLETGVPWIMCKQQNAPDPVINTCNGMQCGKTFPGPNSPNKPSMWTELWTSFVQQYGENPYVRTAEEIAFHAALFILAKNGSYVNYYMYHGGTNFGRTSSAYVVTSYYDLAPLDEFGSIRQPKWGHLKELHTVMKLCSQPLLYGERVISSLGPLKDAYVYQDKSSGKCAAFLVNNDKREAKFSFRNSIYRLPKESISILPDCKNIAFNTAKVNTQYDTRSMVPTQKFDSSVQWQSFKEPVPSYETATLRENSILEHTSITKDRSDYLWYTLRFNHDVPNDTALLSVYSHGHILHAYVNGALVGSAPGYSKSKTFSLDKNVTLNKGINDISLLSVVVGLPDGGAYMERRVLGVRRVWIQNREVTISPWSYQVGLLGENLQIYSDIGSSLTKWNESSNGQPLTWYKTQFDEPAGEKPIALNLGTMGKGEAFVNGKSIGRYWASFLTPKGTPSQTWYHVPRTFLKPSGNLLVIQEEEGGNPLGISIDTVSIPKVCVQVSESRLPPLSSWVRMDQTRERIRNTHHYASNVKLNCPRGKKISNISFASYGNPSGNCGNYTLGSCHSFQSATVVEQACLEKRRCTIPVSNKKFGDPCPRVLKQLLVDAQCN